MDSSASTPDVDVIEECCVGGLNLIDLMAGYDRLIALDSIKTIGGEPGTWYAFDGTAVRENMAFSKDLTPALQECAAAASRRY